MQLIKKYQKYINAGFFAFMLASMIIILAMLFSQLSQINQLKDTISLLEEQIKGMAPSQAEPIKEQIFLLTSQYKNGRIDNIMRIVFSFIILFLSVAGGLYAYKKDNYVVIYTIMGIIFALVCFAFTFTAFKTITTYPNDLKELMPKKTKSLAGLSFIGLFLSLLLAFKCNFKNKMAVNIIGIAMCLLTFICTCLKLVGLSGDQVGFEITIEVLMMLGCYYGIAVFGVSLIIDKK